MIGDFSAELAAGYAIKGLAVAGGFLAGHLLGGGAAFALDRWLFAKMTPLGVKKVARVLTGLAVAVMVAMLVFGKGGGAGFGGGGGGTPDGDPKSTARRPADTKDVPTPVPTAKGADPRPADRVLRVTVLGGDDVRGGRFYLTDDAADPKSFDEVKAAVTAAKAPAGGPKLALAVQFPARNAVARDHPAVTRLVRWANEEAGLDVTFPAGR